MTGIKGHSGVIPCGATDCKLRPKTDELSPNLCIKKGRFGRRREHTIDYIRSQHFGRILCQLFAKLNVDVTDSTTAGCADWGQNAAHRYSV